MDLEDDETIIKLYDSEITISQALEKSCLKKHPTESSLAGPAGPGVQRRTIKSVLINTPSEVSAG